MKKIINSPENVVDEMLEGVLYAHGDELKSVRVDNKAIVRKSSPKKGKVGIITGGGSGHLPLFLGYVGEGMLDGAAVGDIFQSPSPEQILDTIKNVNGGEGVLLLYGNYGGDVFNFDMAAELAEIENIRTLTVLGADDVASMPIDQKTNRRGVAGIFYQFKCAGAAAEAGMNLEETARIAQKVGNQLRTMGVALSPCTIPAVGKPGFEIAEDEMEIGMGIHGEPGIKRCKMLTADEIACDLLKKILEDYGSTKIDKVSVLINGLGATPLEELYVFYRKVYKKLKEENIEIHSTFIGEYATSMEMTGLSISLLNLDDEIEGLLNAPFNTPFHRRY